MAPRFGNDEVVPTSDDEEMQQMHSDPLNLRDDDARTPQLATGLDSNGKAAGSAGPSQPPIAFLAEATDKSSATPPLYKAKGVSGTTDNSSNQTVNTSGTFGSSSVGPHPAIVSAVTPAAQQAAPPRPKPKPRPAYKIRPPVEDGAAQVADTSISTISNVLTPVVPPPQLPSDPIETATSVSSASKGKSKATEEDIESFSLDIAERAKVRSRTKKPTTAPVVDPSDIIELTDSEDELLLPSSKSKSKDMPRKPATSKATKAAATKKTAAGRSPAKKAKTSGHQSEPPDSTPGTIPVLTSEPAQSSQLPPSDPPLPSSANPPPTSTPAGNPSPPLSPVPAPPARKRKRPARAESDEEDESALPKSPLVTAKSAELMPPPPPPAFFAASSSPAGPSSGSGSRDVSQAAALAAPEPKGKGKGKKKAADDEEDDWTFEDSKPKPKGRGRKKKTEEEEDEDWDDKPKPKAKRAPRKKKGDTEAADGTDPSVAQGANPKKAPARGRGKKAQAVAADTEGGEESAIAEPEPAAKKAPARGRGKNKVEVLIEVPSPDKRASKPGSSAQATEPSAPALATEPGLQPEESELSALESDVEGKKRAANAGVTTPEPDQAGSGGAKAPSKGKKRALVLSEDEEDQPPSSKKAKGKAKAAASLSDDEEDNASLAKTSTPEERQTLSSKPPLPRTPAPRPSAAPSSSAASVRSRSHTIPRTKGVPMSELIRRASQAQGLPTNVHSPLIKMTKSALSKIAPLHPNRRSPPPPPPRLPPPKKTKKQLELEEKWEMELEEEVEGWHSLPDAERAALRRAKMDAYYGFDD